MEQLKCKTVNCQHNLKNHCNAPVIGIDEKGRCASKLKRVGGALEQTFAELEAADEFLSDAPAIVQSECDCVYNKDRRCTATSILVQDKLFRTSCATRLKD